MEALQKAPKQSTETMSERYMDLEPSYLGMSIAIVFDELKRTGQKPSSDYKWLVHPKYSAQLLDMIESRWCQLAGIDKDEAKFPYCKTYVAHRWLDFRKTEPIQGPWIEMAKKHFE